MVLSSQPREAIMVTVEFRTKVKNGAIEIPRRFRRNFKDRVRVILVADDEKTTTPTALDEMISHPLKIKNFRPLSREEAHARK
jgi:hypothetical protein